MTPDHRRLFFTIPAVIFFFIPTVISAILIFRPEAHPVTDGFWIIHPTFICSFLWMLVYCIIFVRTDVAATRVVLITALVLTLVIEWIVLFCIVA